MRTTLVTALLASALAAAARADSVRDLSPVAGDGSKEATARLTRALGDDDPAVRAFAAKALATRDLSAAVAIAALADDASPEPRAAMREAMAVVAHREGCGATLAALREQGSAAVRLVLASALAGCSEKAGRAAWASLLDDPDASVRAAADRAFRLSSTDATGPALAQCLTTGSDALLTTCLALVGDLRVSAVLPKVAVIAVGEVGDTAVRRAARATFAAMADDLDAAELAQRATGAVAPTDRSEAIQLLAALPGDRSFVALKAALEDRDEGVRAVAAAALADFGDRRAVANLSKSLTKKENARIRKFIQRALDRLTK